MPGCAATLNGARALGMTGQLGELTENALADLIALPCRGEPGDLFETIVQHQGPRDRLDDLWHLGAAPADDVSVDWQRATLRRVVFRSFAEMLPKLDER